MTKTGFINVHDFGAVGDGIHNDTANIQAAIDAAVARGAPAIQIGKDEPGYHHYDHVLNPEGFGNGVELGEAPDERES